LTPNRLHLSDIAEERSELRNTAVWVAYARREQVRTISLEQPHIPPIPGHADLVNCGARAGNAITTCIDSKVLDKSFIGRIIDEQFLTDLPPNVDPGGENGEFHSFVFDGPIFKERIAYTTGEIVQRDSFYFIDLLPSK